VLDEGTTFIFGSWIRVAKGLGGFNSHLVDSRKPGGLYINSKQRSRRVYRQPRQVAAPRSTQADREDLRF
jgi:hypothetical protein